MSLTTDPTDPKLKEGQANSVGQHKIYLVLSEEERAKGFVRPFRDSYIHIGKRIERKGMLQSLEEALENMSDSAKNEYTKENGWGGFLKYSESENSAIGTFLRQKEFDAFQNGKDHVGGCNGLTKMAQALAETYARDNTFYSSTFCVHCNEHFPLNEFIWDGTNIIVGA